MERSYHMLTLPTVDNSREDYRGSVCIDANSKLFGWPFVDRRYKE